MFLTVWVWAGTAGCSEEPEKVQSKVGQEDDEDDEDDDEEEEEEEEGTRLSEFEKREEAIWEELKALEQQYLKRWGKVFRAERRYPSDLLDAWNDLAYATTGPDGLWRNVARETWMECGKEPDKNVCVNLAEHEEVFEKWDVFQEKISRMEPRRCASILVDHIDDVETYMDTYVLPEPTPTAMIQSAFYKEILNK